MGDMELPEKDTVNVILQREVERVMSERDWSLQRAEIQTGIPASTINRMRKGLNVRAQAVIGFGLKIGESKDRWSKIALGVDPDAPNENEEASACSQMPADILEYFKDPDTAEIVRYYHGLPDEMRSVTKEMLKGMVNAGDIARERREKRTIGRRADARENPSREQETNN